MGKFTYEKEDIKSPLEKYEWDNVWIESTDNLKGNRVLYIGDSISCELRHVITRQTEEKILADGFGTSKGVDNPFFKQSISLFSQQLHKTELILFNNGLHGFHLEDTTEYAKYYEEMVKFLLEEYKDIPLYLVLTTYICNEERLKRVKLRNDAVLKIAEKYNLPVVDLYTVSEKNKELISSDGVHFTKDGYDVVGKEIVSVISRNF